jgi:hypothetical protein
LNKFLIIGGEMTEERDPNVASSLIGVMIGTKRSQAVVRATIFVTVFVLLVVFILFLSIVMWRVTNGSCVKGFGIEISCEETQDGAVSKDGLPVIDLERLRYSYIYLPLSTGALTDCSRVVEEVLRGRGFSTVSSTPNAWRSVRDIGGERVVAAIQCASTDSRYYFFGMTFGLNGTLVSDENKAIHDMAVALNNQYSELFTPRGGEIPYFHVSNASFPIQFISSELECGAYAKNSLRKIKVFNVVGKSSYAYADFNGGKIVAFCVRSYDSEEYVIAVGAFGYSPEENERMSDLLIEEMRTGRDRWLAENDESPNITVVPDEALEE